MNHLNDSTHNTRFTGRALLFAAGGALCVVAIVSVGLSLLYGAGGRITLPGQASATKTAIAQTSGVPLNIPTPTGNTPPLGQRFTLPDTTTSVTPTATPCPVEAPPDTALGPKGTATPPAASRVLPVCGSGRVPGPQCFTRMPFENPSQDVVRQTLYDVALARNFSFSLIEAVAWQESGWQQNVVACDGGVGLMQLMPDTTTWLNTEFGTNYDPKDLVGNVNLGVMLLNWTYQYYIPFCNEGLTTGQQCDGDTVWPQTTDGATVRQILISAYNEGIGTMAKYGIINWGYVNSVSDLRDQFLAAQ